MRKIGQEELARAAEYASETYCLAPAVTLGMTINPQIKFYQIGKSDKKFMWAIIPSWLEARFCGSLHDSIEEIIYYLHDRAVNICSNIMRADRDENGLLTQRGLIKNGFITSGQAINLYTEVLRKKMYVDSYIVEGYPLWKEARESVISKENELLFDALNLFVDLNYLYRPSVNFPTIMLHLTTDVQRHRIVTKEIIEQQIAYLVAQRITTLEKAHKNLEAIISNLSNDNLNIGEIIGLLSN